MSAPAAERDHLLVLAELTLTGLTVCAVLGLGRLFVDGSFLPQVLLATVAAHGLAALCRRRRLGGATTAGVALLGAVLLTAWTQLGDTTVLGVPTTSTLDQAQAELSEAWRTFGQVIAPAPVLPGFVLAASLGVWVIAFTADAAAFRGSAEIEAVVPASTLFVFGGALGTADDRIVLAALFLAAILGHWLAQRALWTTSAPTWLASPEAGGGTRSLLRLGAGLAAVGVAAAVVVGPNLPGADDRAVIPWRATDRDSPDSRVTISPLVDIRTRLVDQADLEVFRVTSDERSYWRLTSLERFDGRRWTSDRTYRPARGRLGTDVDTSRANTVLSTQRFTVGALSTIWLPAAFRPVALDGADARYDSDSNSLLTEAETAVGQTYTVESALPRFDPAGLQRVPPVAPRAIADGYTALPGDFSPRVRALAFQLTAGARTQYERARALQDHFHSGAFTYDLDAPPGHSGDDLEHFLFTTRRGYCEQYAGAYAAMARAVGLPSRVAVGFTPGELDPATGEYVVRGFNGHAWPEVYLDGFGWVPFEPTPGRGAPGAEAWTGRQEQQAEPGNPASATTVPTTTPTTVAPQDAPTTVPAQPLPEDPLVEPEREGSPWPSRILVGLALAVLLPLLWVGVLLALRSWRRRRRRAAAVSPRQRVLVSWEEVEEALARVGAEARRWETPEEYARRASVRTGLDRALLSELAGVTTAATYGADAVSADAAERAATTAGTLERAADAMLPGRERLRFLVDPRPLLAGRGRDAR